MTDEERQLLRDLEDEFVVGCRYWYVLQLWQECGSFEASSIEDRIRVAYAVLKKAGEGGTQWVWTGWIELVDHLIERLDDPVAEVRQQAAIALGDLQDEGRRAVPVLLDRLQSSAITFHDRACAAWALGQIKHDVGSGRACSRCRSARDEQIRKRLASFAVIPPRQSSGSPTTRRAFVGGSCLSSGSLLEMPDGRTWSGRAAWRTRSRTIAVGPTAGD